MAGVANWRGALPVLEGIDEVILAFDQEPPRGAREAVSTSAWALAHALTGRGAKVLWAAWDWRLAKGVDDALRLGVRIFLS